jgi:hypothetical protein
VCPAASSSSSSSRCCFSMHPSQGRSGRSTRTGFTQYGSCLAYVSMAFRHVCCSRSNDAAAMHIM